MFFFYSKWGDLLPLARMVGEGEMYVDDDKGEHVGEGLVERTDNPNPPSGSVVVFDDTGLGHTGNDLRNRGFAVIGGNPFDRALGKKRAEGMSIMEAHGIAIPENHEFPTIKSGIKFLEKHGEGDWFVKVDGDLGNSSTTNGSAAMVIRYLDWLGATNSKVRGVELQRKVDGAEISIEGWFDGEQFIYPFNATIEEKKFMAGDKGPRTGCESCVVFPYAGPLSQELEKVADTLRSEGYQGSLDLNVIVTEKGPLGLEWTARLGFDSSHALFHLLGPTLPEQLEAFAYGVLPEWDIQDTLALTLRFSVPPYPNEDSKDAAKLLGFPLDKGVLDTDVTDVRVTSGLPECAGRDGLLGVVTVLGDSIEELRRGALAKVGSFKIPNLQYRVDPVKRFEKTMKQLEERGMV